MEKIEEEDFIKLKSSRCNVFVRARACSESNNHQNSVVSFPSINELSVKYAKQETTYRFDRVYSLKDENNKICDEICQPLVDAFFKGYNSCFLAYGQTGTGKTHTIFSEDGLAFQTINEAITKIQHEEHFSQSLTFSYLQIYQDKIFDLLVDLDNVSLNLREHPKEGIIVEGLSEHSIQTFNQACDMLERGRKKLIVSGSAAGYCSNRSHVMCIMKIVNIADTSNKQSFDEILDFTGSTCIESTKRKLYLCDLAGSERLKKTDKTDKRCNETRSINSSLLELGNVIHALATRNNPYVPFRNSKLTRLLKEGLGGKSKAALMICISSSIDDIKETRASLNFGQRAMKVVKYSVSEVEEDYKALSEVLSSKLKELENAYRTERENLKELKALYLNRNNKDDNDDAAIQQTQLIPNHTKNISLVVEEKFFDTEHSAEKSKSNFFSENATDPDYYCEIREHRDSSIQTDAREDVAIAAQQHINEDSIDKDALFNETEKSKTLIDKCVQTQGDYNLINKEKISPNANEEGFVKSSQQQVKDFATSEKNYPANLISHNNEGIIDMQGCNQEEMYSKEPTNTPKKVSYRSTNNQNKAFSNENAVVHAQTSQRKIKDYHICYNSNSDNRVSGKFIEIEYNKLSANRWNTGSNSKSLPNLKNIKFLHGHSVKDGVEDTSLRYRATSFPQIGNELCVFGNKKLVESIELTEQFRKILNEMNEPIRSEATLNQFSAIAQKEVKTIPLSLSENEVKKNIGDKDLYSSNISNTEHDVGKTSKKSKSKIISDFYYDLIIETPFDSSNPYFNNVDVSKEVQNKTNIHQDYTTLSSTNNVSDDVTEHTNYTFPIEDYFIYLQNEIDEELGERTSFPIDKTPCFTKKQISCSQRDEACIKERTKIPLPELNHVSHWNNANVNSSESSISEVGNPNNSLLDMKNRLYITRDTEKAKKDLNKVQKKYEKLIKQFDHVLNDQSSNEIELNTSKSCYNLILKFKSELELELQSARENFSHAKPFQIDLDNRDEKKEEVDHLFSDVEQSLCSINEEIDQMNAKQKYLLNISDEGFQTCPSLSSISTSTPITKPKNKELSEKRHSMPGKLSWLSKPFSRHSKEKAKRKERLTLAAIENTEIKKELLLTKLEKNRLEAVLSCMMAESRDQDGLSMMRNLTSSRSTMSSSCSNIPLSPVAFQPFKKYNYKDRIMVGAEFPPSFVQKKDASAETSMLSLHSRQSSISEFEISSMSDITSASLLTRISPYGEAIPEEATEKNDRCDDLIESEMQAKYDDQEMVVGCLPFRKSKSFRKKSKSKRKNSKTSS